jgi:hypothetical protein
MQQQQLETPRSTSAPAGSKELRRPEEVGLIRGGSSAFCSSRRRLKGTNLRAMQVEMEMVGGRD